MNMEIPQSPALQEANGGTLAEMLSKDPFEFTKQDRGLIVAALREQRAKWEASEAVSASKPKAVKLPVSPKTLIAKASASDLGF